MWTNPGWFIYQLEVQIWFWSSAAWPKPSSTWSFPLCILVLYGELIPLSFLNEISPPPLLSKPPVSVKPLSNGLKINKPPGGLIEDLPRKIWLVIGVTTCKTHRECKTTSIWKKEGTKQRKSSTNCNSLFQILFLYLRCNYKSYPATVVILQSVPWVQRKSVLQPAIRASCS